MAKLPVKLSNVFDKRKPSVVFTQLSNFTDKRFISVGVIMLMLSFSGQALSAQDDSDGDGLSDSYEVKIGTESYLSDTDGDGINDGDEIGGKQATPLDSDNDGVINALDYDDDNDGLPTYLESKKDSDKDGVLGYLDTDSDNDGVADGEESGFLNQDKNLDGIDDAFDLNRDGAVDANGDGIDDNIKLPDHNNDGKPDYLDGKFQRLKQILVDKKSPKANKLKEIDVAKKVKDKVVAEVKVPAKAKIAEKPKAVKKPKDIAKVEAKTEPKKESADKPKKSPLAKPEDMVINRHTDSDNDGLSNELEKRLGTNHLKRDSDGDKVSDAIEIGLDVNAPQDSDRDGIIDALDPDDDNDGILTKFEDLNKDSTAINDDTDNDGVPNYLDANDDGDNLLTKQEGSTLDSDGDGILNYLDKNDGEKDTANQTAKNTNKEIPAEPEVVVLFDGDAARLAESDEALSQDSDSPIQDAIVSSLDDTLDNGIDQTDAVSNVESDAANEKINTLSSSKKANHWNLF